MIGTKWVFRNKLDTFGIVTRNKTRLLVKEYNQEKGIYFDEIFIPIAILEAMCILLIFVSHMDNKLF